MAWRLHRPSGVSLPAPLRLLKEPHITFYLVLDVCPQLRNILNARRALQTPRPTGSQYAMFVPQPFVTPEGIYTVRPCIPSIRGNIFPLPPSGDAKSMKSEWHVAPACNTGHACRVRLSDAVPIRSHLRSIKKRKHGKWECCVRGMQVAAEIRYYPSGAH